MRREERIEQRRRQCLHQAITRFVCVCGCLVFGPDLNDDVDDDGASELRSHLRRHNGTVVMSSALLLLLPGTQHNVTV